MNHLTVVIISLLIIIPVQSFAEFIPITKSTQMEKVIFDGKWTFDIEWKKSSLTRFDDHKEIYLRMAHQDNFIYVLIDALPDNTFDRGLDKAMICFDSKNDKTEYANDDDFCFIATLGKNTGVTIQGGSPIAVTSNFKNVSNHPEYIGIGQISDNEDRYSQTPHASYEFRIPIELLGRSDNYGFYASVFDYNLKTVYSWPSVDLQKTNIIPSPSKWGEIISPDKTLPEISTPIIILSIIMISIMVLSKQFNSLKLLEK